MLTVWENPLITNESMTCHQMPLITANRRFETFSRFLGTFHYIPCNTGPDTGETTTSGTGQERVPADVPIG